METLFGKALGDVANLVKEKWYAGMGFMGLLIFAYVLLFGTAQDDILVGSISLAMMCIGFGEAETRTFIQAPDIIGERRYMVTTPVRRMTAPGICLYIVGIFAALTGVGRAIFLML